MLKAINIPYFEAEKIEKLKDDTVLISISSDYEDRANLKVDRLSNKVLSVDFPDITARMNKAGNWIEPIDSETVLKILDFINIHKDKNFIVHCHAGVSRSAAVCLYLHIEHGHALKENFWHVSHPNKYVLGMLFSIRYYKDYVKPR